MSLPRFRRSTTDKKIVGLFGGLGDSFGIDPTYLRLAFVLLALLTGVVPAMIAYAIGWLITVEGPAPEAPVPAPEKSPAPEPPGNDDPGERLA